MKSHYLNSHFKKQVLEGELDEEDLQSIRIIDSNDLV